MQVKYGRRGLPVTFHAATLVDQISRRVADDSVNARSKQDLIDYYTVIEEQLSNSPVTEAGARALLKTYREEGSTRRIAGLLWFAYDDACRRFMHEQGDPRRRLSYIQAGFRLR